MTKGSLLGLSLALAIASGCGSSQPDLDAGGSDAAIDAAVADAGGSDGGGDGGSGDGGAGDAGRGDSGADGGSIDSGIDAAVTGSCDPNLGSMCIDVCASGLECNLGRCVPQSRPICGGFAGASCDEPTFPYCLYFARADFGTCVTAAEAACLCARAPGSFTSCP